VVDTPTYLRSYERLIFASSAASQQLRAYGGVMICLFWEIIRRDVAREREREIGDGRDLYR